MELGPELQKALAETDNYRVFLELCEQLVKTNEKICELRGRQWDENDGIAERKNTPNGTSYQKTEIFLTYLFYNKGSEINIFVPLPGFENSSIVPPRFFIRSEILYIPKLLIGVRPEK